MTEAEDPTGSTVDATRAETDTTTPRAARLRSLVDVRAGNDDYNVMARGTFTEKDTDFSKLVIFRRKAAPPSPFLNCSMTSFKKQVLYCSIEIDA